MSNLPSVLIAIPCYDGIMREKTAIGIFNLAREFTKLGIKHSLVTLANESLISRGRSKLFSFFYNETDYDKMIFIDADVGFKSEDVIKLLELDVDFCVAGVPLKTTPPKYNFGVIYDKNEKLVWNKEKTAFEVDFCGTAFFMLDRKVHEKMSNAYSNLKYYPSLTHTNRPSSEKAYNNTYYFFQPYIDETGDLKSEDYSFCKRWKDLGEKIWLVPSIQLNHTGSNVFEGIELNDIFKDK